MGSITVYRSTKGISTRKLIEDELPETLTKHGRIVASGTSPYFDGQTAFYAAVENTDGRRWALVVLYVRRPDAFWHKDMDETVGPVADAPRNVLEALSGHEPATDSAREWREEAWASLAKREAAKALKAGSTIRYPRVLEFGRGKQTTCSGDTFELIDAKKSIFIEASSRTVVRLTGWQTERWTLVRA